MDFVNINTSDLAVTFAIGLTYLKRCKFIHKPRSFIKKLVAQLLIVAGVRQFGKGN
jgi:hypothetical protein